jgi:3-oxoacyl-[acyl-carrier protein] reductase
MKFALITGASGGIGQAIAIQLAQEGWNLYLHYHRQKHVIEKLTEQLAPFKGEYIPVYGDLSTKEGVSHVLNQLFTVDALVYAAGNAPYGLLVDMDDDTIERTIELHVLSPLRLVRCLLPKMKNGNIVFISSIWGQTGAACEVVYSTVKGAQISFVKALAKEVASQGVRVNAVAPGAVQTNMLQAFTEDELRALEEEIPLGRLAKPQEVAQAVSYLLSERASYITGHILSVNGGWYT